MNNFHIYEEVGKGKYSVVYKVRLPSIFETIFLIYAIACFSILNLKFQNQNLMYRVAKRSPLITWLLNQLRKIEERRY